MSPTWHTPPSAHDAPAVASAGAASCTTAGAPVEAAGDGDDDAEAEASFCTAPDETAVVDEHPASAAVASTNPTVSSFKRVLISFPDL